MKSNRLIPVLFPLLLVACAGEPDSKTSENNLFADEITTPVMTFEIDPERDTTIFGEQGTRIFIEPGTFQFTDGTPVTGPVTVELKEFYETADIVLADLATVSDGQLLETGGMLNIKAFSEGKPIEIKPDKDIVVHFPKARNDYRKMNLFYPDAATDSSVSNWSVDTVDLVRKTLKLGSFGWWHPAHDDSTGYDFTPKDYVDTGYYWNPIDLYVKTYPFSDSAIAEINTSLNSNDYENFENWNDYGVECEMKISTEGYIHGIKLNTKVSRETRKEIVQFLKDLPQLEPGTNKNGEIIERRGLLFIQGGEIVPLYETREDYLKSFDQKYAEYEDRPIKNMDDAELNYYIFRVSQLGWINCDRFIDSEETIDMLVQMPIEPQTQFKLIFSDIDGVLKANKMDEGYVFSNVPKGEWVTLFGMKNEHGLIKTTFKRTNIKETIGDLTFEDISLSELREKLNDL